MSVRSRLCAGGPVLAAALGALWTLGGETLGAQHPSLVVHEWGVLVRGTTPLGRRTLGGPAELAEGLPAFVLRLDKQYTPRRQDIGWDKPVLHFHGAEGLRVRVRVGTPLGRPIAYWPRPTLIEQVRTISDPRQMMMYSLTDVVALEWSGVLAAKAPPGLPAVPPGHWWQQARDVPGLYFCTEKGSDRFLFYEATAIQDPTVTAELTGDTMTLRNADERDSGPVAVIVNDGQARWAARVPLVPAKGETALARSALSEKLGAEAALLALCRAHWVGFGMTEREAEAIVATWRADLLDTIGVLVVSRMPREVYDTMFPLTVDPKPKELVRVGMVFDALAGQAARAQWLPGLPRTLEQLGRDLGHDAFENRAAAQRRLARIGDLARPALERWSKSDNPEIAVSARRLLEKLEEDEEQLKRWGAWKGKSAAPHVTQTGPERAVE